MDRSLSPAANRVPAAYQAALNTIYQFYSESKNGLAHAETGHDLTRIQTVLERMGNPQQRFRAVHVAGTKGKGSTAAMTEAVLHAAGYRTGLFTSPHLHTFRERMRVDEELISQQSLVDLVERLQPVFRSVPGITTFEIMTALAFQYFADAQVDWGVIEVGMGGRLDPTNVILPQVAVITSISYDHMAVLGGDLTSIAREKAGIIKPGVPVISAPQTPEVTQVIAQTCLQRQAPLIQIGTDWTFTLQSATLEGQAFQVSHLGADSTPDQVYDLWLPLAGAHQLANATAVVAVVDCLRQQGAHISGAALQKGLHQVQWPGRFEVLRVAGERTVVIDGAHNADSAAKLVSALHALFPERPLDLIFGASKDKDIAGMLAQLLPAVRSVTTTGAHHPRASDPEELVAEIQRVAPTKQVQAIPEVADALSAALGQSNSEGVIVITGSLFAAAEARVAWSHQHPALPPLKWVDELEPQTI